MTTCFLAWCHMQSFKRCAELDLPTKMDKGWNVASLSHTAATDLMQLKKNYANMPKKNCVDTSKEYTANVLDLHHSTHEKHDDIVHWWFV